MFIIIAEFIIQHHNNKTLQHIKRNSWRHRIVSALLSEMFRVESVGSEFRS